VIIGKTGLLVMDLQRDFGDDDGAFVRNGFSNHSIKKIVPRVAKVMTACRGARIPIIATRLTILTDLDGRPMGADHILKMRPFLNDGGFRAGTDGHELLRELPEPDYLVDKWGYSAMYQSILEKVLDALGVRHLVLCGISTYGVIESTARDATARNHQVTTLLDCVAGYDRALHNASLKNLASLGALISGAEFIGDIPLGS
jgi:ureidoacrylate peracid hydrolase